MDDSLPLYLSSCPGWWSVGLPCEMCGLIEQQLAEEDCVFHSMSTAVQWVLLANLNFFSGTQWFPRSW